MLVVGEREEQEGTVSVRQHGSGDLGSQTIEAFIAFINEEIKKQSGDL